MSTSSSQVYGTRDAVQHTLKTLGSVVITPQNHLDPLSAVVAAVDSNTENVAFLGSAESLFFGLGHLSSLQTSPVVLHAEVSGDYLPITSLRTSGFVFLQSFGPEDAQDMAIVAHMVALKQSKPVVHFFASSKDQAPLKWTPEMAGAALADMEVTAGESLETALCIAGREYSKYEYRGPQNATRAVIVLGATDLLALAAAKSNTGLLGVRVLAPFDADELLKSLPATVKELAVLEQVSHTATGLPPLTEDIFGADFELVSKYKIRSFVFGDIANAEEAEKIINASFTDAAELGAKLGGEFTKSAGFELQKFSEVEHEFNRDSVYLDVLEQVFPKLSILNISSEVAASDPKDSITTPEYAFGQFLALQQKRDEKVKEVQASIKQGKVENAEALSQWTRNPFDTELLAGVPEDLKELFGSQDWIVGSDSWSYDYGMSGVHHVLSSGKNVNMLVVETAENFTAKRDIGLYAMTMGGVYAASVAVYGGYTQLLQALLEAEAFNGPSVVVAFLPKGTDSVDVLKRTKRAIQSGKWPLYRYNGEDITLDSYTLKQSLKEFLERDQKLTMLARKTPQLARNLQSSVGRNQRELQKQEAEAAYALLLEGLSGPPVQVLYASDGGQAESVAKRLARRAKARGLKAKVCAFDDYDLETMAREPHVIFITSTAGQGEFPQNGRQLWEQLKSENVDLGQTNVAVFGMGDSQYWPRKQDKHFYNKPSKDVWKRLETLGAQFLVEELGQGDDQDADGWSTGYDAWEQQLWKALHVDNVDAGDEPPPLTNEDMKRDSNFLRGTIAEELKDQSTGSVCAVSQQLTKFHGIYMQDDRDVREERKKAGLEPAYSFMVRVRLPGCVATPDQWLIIDKLSDERGNGTIKITTRGTFQLHGVVKEDLKPAIRGMNSKLMDTVAACGDVNRNVVGSAAVHSANVHRQVAKISNDISEHLLPQTTAYYEIWLEGKEDSDEPGYTNAVETRAAGPVKKKNKHLVAQSPPVLEGTEDVEPLYTPLYLPRKFKVNIAVPPVNDVDVYGHDVGLIAIVENNNVVGFNVLVGGGMGTTHNNRKTYPRTGSLIGFAKYDEVVEVTEKVMLVQRDFGNRENRKHARLKYTVDDLTVEGFKAKVEEYLGRSLEEAREHVAFESNLDVYGWVRDEEGYNHFTTFVENGRVEDTPELKHRTGFREIAHYMKKNNVGEFRLTANQHIIVAAIPDSYKQGFEELLAKYKLDNLAFSTLRLSSQACVAFPTCGLAMAESERYLPELVTKLEGALEEYGLKHDSVVFRMTGCPNGCARPWLAEVALVGKAYGAYNLMLGGGHVGQRLNKLYRSSLKEDEILSTLKPMFKSWALEREEGEPFGDFVIRKGIIKATTQGLDWWDDVEPGLE